MGWQHYCKERYISSKTFLKIYNGNSLPLITYPIIGAINAVVNFTETGVVKVSSSQFKIDDNFDYNFYANNHEYAL